MVSCIAMANPVRQPRNRLVPQPSMPRHLPLNLASGIEPRLLKVCVSWSSSSYRRTVTPGPSVRYRDYSSASKQVGTATEQRSVSKAGSPCLVIFQPRNPGRKRTGNCSKHRPVPCLRQSFGHRDAMSQEAHPVPVGGTLWRLALRRVRWHTAQLHSIAQPAQRRPSITNCFLLTSSRGTGNGAANRSRTASASFTNRNAQSSSTRLSNSSLEIFRSACRVGLVMTES